jgi:phage tail-like protein
VPRSRLSDVLHSHLFWAFDASNSGVPVFNPLFGFSRISAPEISAEIETFKDGTFLYNRSVVKGGSVSPVLFERAASMFDADFYDWIMFTLHGNKDFEEGGTLGKISNFLTSGGRVSPRRNLLIVQFTNINIAGGGDGVRDIALRVAGTAAIAAITAGLAGSSVAGAAIAGAAVGGSVALGIGPFEFATRIPARAWLLHNCLPIRYKSGSDFDAANASISLQELEVQPEQIEEFSLGIKP